MFGYKSVIGAITAAALIGSSAFAATAGGALAPGKPAGVQKAQTETGAIILGIGGAAILAGIAIVVSQESGNKEGQPTSFAPVTTAP
jgi:hypothetical protein